MDDTVRMHPGHSADKLSPYPLQNPPCQPRVLFVGVHDVEEFATSHVLQNDDVVRIQREGSVKDR